MGKFPEPRDSEHVGKDPKMRKKAEEKKEREKGNASGVGLTEPELGISLVV